MNFAPADGAGWSRLGGLFLVLMLSALLCSADEQSMASAIGKTPQRSATTEPGGWTLTVGLNHRIFKDVDFGPVAFRNFGVQAAGVASTGPGDPAGLGNGPYGVQGIASPLDAAHVTVLPTFEDTSDVFNVTVPVDYVRFLGGPLDEASGTGVSLQLSCGLWGRGSWSTSLVGGAQYCRAELSDSRRGDMFAHSGRFVTEQYTHMLVDVDGVWLDGSSTGVINPAQALNPSPVAGTSTVYSLQNRLDMNLFVFDLGCQVSYLGDRFSLRLATGPALGLVNIRTSQKTRAAWGDINSTFPSPPLTTSPVVIGADSYSARHSDSSLRLTAAWYASVGVAYTLTPSLTLSADFRHDVFDEPASSDQASLDLDSTSIQLGLSVEF